MEAETWHLPEYRCLAPSLRPVTEPYWLRTPQCKFEQRFLHGDGPAQVGLGSFEPHRLYIKTERSVPATHANIEHRTSNIERRMGKDEETEILFKILSRLTAVQNKSKLPFLVG
jgi:hypothetical protein